MTEHRTCDENEHLTLDDRYAYTLEVLTAEGLPMEGPDIVTLLSFLEDNDFEPEEIHELMSLRPGDEWLTGGGAAPIAIIRCVSGHCPSPTSASECATIRERKAAGQSDTISDCPIHGPYTDA